MNLSKLNDEGKAILERLRASLGKKLIKSNTKPIGSHLVSPDLADMSSVSPDAQSMKP